ncbi:MAG: methionine gamma-lyase family protein [Oscillospiraceae bacterium]|nr:methionine gamma-lyase family protein [Oscillospiraceae bacterium]
MEFEKLIALAESNEERLQGIFRGFERTAESNTRRVLDAFREYRVSDACFAGTTGYGYDDLGRETLEKVYARVFGAEKALVRTQFVNGTHALACALYGALQPGDTMLSVTGTPYDTLQTALFGAGRGTLASYGVVYREIALASDGGPDYEAIRESVSALRPALVYIQRSRGYDARRALSVQEIGEIVKVTKSANPDTAVMVDNCYGEFTDILEPCHVGADLMAGSLIKNPGGGIAPGGGYVAGRADLVDYAAERLSVPGIGGECGATLGVNRLLFQGFFFAPHTVCQALKTMAFAAAMLESLGYRCSPSWSEKRSDIIETIELRSAEALVKFCQGIQKGSPVDSFAAPVPAPMPGYESQVVMAAGTFIQGASLELSCDGPVREPYLGYLQGGLTYESGKLGVLRALQEMLS